MKNLVIVLLCVGYCSCYWIHIQDRSKEDDPMPMERNEKRDDFQWSTDPNYQWCQDEGYECEYEACCKHLTCKLNEEYDLLECMK